MFGRCCVVPALLLSVPVAAAGPVRPSGKWTVDYAVARCAASRPFGPGNEPLTLTIVPAHSGGSARIVLSNAWTELKGVEHTATLDFMDAAPLFRTDAMPAISFGPSRAVIIIDLPAEQAARLRKASVIKVVSSTITDRTLELGPTTQLFAALDKCLADLRTYWNIDQPPAQPGKPKSDLESLFSWSNYPSVGDHRAKSNTVETRLLVDEKGHVGDCLIMAGSGSTAIDEQTCQILELRVGFEPAKDRDNQPVRSAVDVTVVWRR